MTITVGILTLYVGRRRTIEERPFLAACANEGVKLGIEVIVFTPEDVEHRSRRVRAHLYDVRRKRWLRAWRPLPSVIFDRCRYQSTPRFAQMRAFRRRYPHLQYLNHPLANKWLVHEVLARHAHVARHLPDTGLLRGMSDALRFGARHSTIYIKPVNGTGGRGILRLQCSPSASCRLEGRNAQRTIIASKTGSRSELLRHTLRLCRGGSYLLQQAIDNRLSNGQVFDFRLVVQKDGSGKWTLTGGAARVGGPRSITSNLHGGGRAVGWQTMLTQQFTAKRSESIVDDMKTLAIRVAEALEQRYGRLCELGLDIAVDRSGKPWLLEVNPKPAREIFRKTGQHATYRTAIRKPLEFAIFLSR